MSTLLKTMEETLKEYIELVPSPTSDIGPLSSKFGGVPFLPEEIFYPLREDDSLLYFLAQLNFNEIPFLRNFPLNGLLQFYVSDKIEKKHKGKKFKVLYIPESQFHSLKPKELSQDYCKIDGTYKLDFLKKRMPNPVCEHGFADVYDEIFKTELEAENFEEEFFSKYHKLCEHRIGGYPHTSKPIEKKFHSIDKEPILLLQIESDTYMHWSKYRFTNFLISQDDLENLDFSNVDFFCY